MKKNVWILVFVLIVFGIFNVVQAADKNEMSADETKKVENLYDYISKMKMDSELIKDLDAKTYIQDYIKTGDGGFSIQKISKALVRDILKEVTASLKILAILLVIAIICALITNLENAFSNGNLSNIAYFACYSLIIIVLSKGFLIGVDVARATIGRVSDFMHALMPVLLMLLASVGGFTEATTMDPIIIGVVNIAAKLFSSIIIPLILISFVLQFVNNLSKDFKLGALTKLMNQVALWVQGICMTVFIGFITIRGITSKTIDAVTVKTAKYAVDNFVPVVGKCLSDSISTVAGYSLLMKNAIGSVGLVVIIAIMILPIIKLLVMGLMYKLTAAIIEPISEERIVKCIGAAGDSLLLVMSSLISVSIMCFIMVAIVASAGKMAIGG